VKDLNPLYTDPAAIQGNPFLADMLLLGQGGSRTVSKIVPSLVHNTIDNPIFPTAGRRFSLSMDLAGLGGDTNFFKPMVEGVWYIPHTRRTSFGLRGQFAYIRQFTGSLPLPIFERLYLGGEYSIRGFDLRTVGPKAPDIITPPLYLGQPLLPELMPGVQSLEPTVTPSLLVIGGNKSLLFNAEYLISIAGPVRLVLFYDAGQALDKGQNFGLDEFKTSTGAEIRFFMPVLNVPFRLIFAYNPQRGNVYNNNLLRQPKFTFRFAVGSTF
jgi:outer membrane protein insertion porin family